MNSIKAKIGDKEIELRATAALPLFYRSVFGEDLLQDYKIVSNQIEVLRAERGDTFAYEDIYTPEVVNVLEQLIYCMAKMADDTIPGNILVWMNTLPLFELYGLFPTVLQLWQITTQTKSTLKKKKEGSTEKAQ